MQKDDLNIDMNTFTSEHIAQAFKKVEKEYTGETLTTPSYEIYICAKDSQKQIYKYITKLIYHDTKQILIRYLNRLTEYYSSLHGLKYIYHLNINSDTTSIYLLESNAKAMVICSYDNDGKDMYISSLSVDEDIRNNGIANTLLHMSEDIASLLFRNVILWVACGTWMVDWYKRKGYTINGTSKKYIKMRKCIQYYTKK